MRSSTCHLLVGPLRIDQLLEVLDSEGELLVLLLEGLDAGEEGLQEGLSLGGIHGK